jgi:2-oxoisovalerate dehydrogenase E1 component
MRGCIGIGHSAATHHSGNHYPLYANFPGLHVVVPSTPYDAKGLFLRALRCADPVLFFEHRELLTLKGPVPEEDYEIEFGKAAVVRKGSDVTVVALALMVQHTLKACAALEKEGVSVEVIDPRTLVPLDADAIRQSVRKTGRLIVVDESPPTCSVASEITACVAEDWDTCHMLRAPVRRVCAPAVPVPFSPPLEDFVLPDQARIAAAIREVLGYR